MNPRNRIDEAIKQTQIVREEVNDADTRRKLERSLDALESGLTSLETGQSNEHTD